MAPEFEPSLWFCVDSSEPGAYFGLHVTLSLSAPPLLALSLCLSKISTHLKKEKEREGRSPGCLRRLAEMQVGVGCRRKSPRTGRGGANQ